MELLNHTDRKDEWKRILEGAFRNIEQNGGDSIDADVILGHFGLIGDWIMPILEKICNGLATALDVLLLKEHMMRWER